jgi:hypothetical protein
MAMSKRHRRTIVAFASTAVGPAKTMPKNVPNVPKVNFLPTTVKTLINTMRLMTVWSVLIHITVQWKDSKNVPNATIQFTLKHLVVKQVLHAIQVPILNPVTIYVPSVLWAPLPIPLIKVVAKIAPKDGMLNPLPRTMVAKNVVVENTVMQQKSLMLGLVVKIVPLVVFLNTKALMDRW